MGAIRRQATHRAALCAAAGVTGLGVLMTGPAVHAETGGVVLDFGLTQRLEATENLPLEASSDGTTWEASTGLTAGLTLDTGISKLTFGTSATLRVIDAPGAPTETEFTDSGLSMGYTRLGAGSSFTVSGSWREDDLRFLRPLSDFTDPDTGEIILPDDLDELVGTGTRANTSLKAALKWNEDAPLSYGLTASFSDLDYTDTSSTTLYDSSRVGLTGSVTATLSPVTRLKLKAGQSRFESDEPGNERRTTTSYDADLTHDRPNGALRFGLSVDDTEDGVRTALTFGRTLELKQGELGVELGVTEGVTGDTTMTGSLSWQQDLPQGTFSLAAKRSVGPGSDDGERVISSLSLALSQDLGPRTGLSLGLDYVDSEETATGDTSTNADLSASLSRALTPDWSLDLGYVRRLRDSGATDATSDSVFLQLGRDFSLRP